MDNTIRKIFALENAKAIKQLGETGVATIRFAVIGVKDSDDDIMQAGAFTEGQVVTILPTHQWGAQPLGKGKIRVESNDVLCDIIFNMKSQAAEEWHSWLKFDLQPETGEPIQQWSWGWDWRNLKFRTERIDGEEVRIFEKVDVIEVSPVLRGAGSNTGTVSVKSKGTSGMAYAPHTTETTNEPWSLVDAVCKFKGDLAEVHHHVTNAEGKAGAASTVACLNEIAVLNGKRAGVAADPAAKQAVYDHLAAHLKDAGIDAPPLDLTARSGLKFSDEVGVAIQAVHDVRDLLVGLKSRVDGLKATRAGDGRELSEVKIAEINAVVAAVKSLTLLELGGDAHLTEEVVSAKLRTIHKNLA